MAAGINAAAAVSFKYRVNTKQTYLIDSADWRGGDEEQRERQPCSDKAKGTGKKEKKR